MGISQTHTQTGRLKSIHKMMPLLNVRYMTRGVTHEDVYMKIADHYRSDFHTTYKCSYKC